MQFTSAPPHHRHCTQSRITGTFTPNSSTSRPSHDPSNNRAPSGAEWTSLAQCCAGTSAHGAVARRGVPAAAGGQGEHTQGGAQARVGAHAWPAAAPSQHRQGTRRGTSPPHSVHGRVQHGNIIIDHLRQQVPLAANLPLHLPSMHLLIFPAAVVLEETLAMPTSGSACQLSEPQPYGRCPRLRCHAGQTLNAC